VAGLFDVACCLYRCRVNSAAPTEASLDAGKTSGKKKYIKRKSPKVNPVRTLVAWARSSFRIGKASFLQLHCACPLTVVGWVSFCAPVMYRARQGKQVGIELISNFRYLLYAITRKQYIFSKSQLNHYPHYLICIPFAAIISSQRCGIEASNSLR
jgi:hypothetical protein